MRDLKFRAWDGHTMHNPNDCDEFDFYISCEGEIKFIEETSLGGYEPFRHFRHRQSWQVMQFTGLQDKNGVEIYEGDILATSNNGKDGADIWILEVMGEVYWNGKFACWNHRIALNDDESIYSPQYVEVIGNIYQNPELLKS
jgi:uncharacterized phage protein (TIGR01671 family)